MALDACLVCKRASFTFGKGLRHEGVFFFSFFLGEKCISTRTSSLQAEQTKKLIQPGEPPTHINDQNPSWGRLVMAFN